MWLCRAQARDIHLSVAPTVTEVKQLPTAERIRVPVLAWGMAGLHTSVPLAASGIASRGCMKQKLDDTAGRECPKIGQVPRQMGDMPKG